MSPLRSVINQYLGINAHLHSLWQSEGGWSDFHNRHIGDLTGLLREQLLPMGYTARLENSLQIRRIDDSTVTNNPIHEVPYRAIGILQDRTESQEELVTWIELLSPTSKGNKEDATAYTNKRKGLLESGVVLVEMDYLHETPSTFRAIADYTAKANRSHRSEAHPYRIATLDPRPNLHKGQAHLCEFDADTLIPMVSIPLNDSDYLRFDFDAAYQKTYREMFYGMELVDYREMPLNFDRYSEADQVHIARRMVAVLQAAHDGVNLETGPFPVQELSLQEALERIQTFRDTSN